jgi:hypothetical protein
VLAARNIARELLPLVVVAWATLAILGGAVETGEHGSAADEGSMKTAGLGLCAITLAIVLTDGLRKMRRPHKLITNPARRPRRLFSRTTSRPAARAKPPPAALSLEHLQILRI